MLLRAFTLATVFLIAACAQVTKAAPSLAPTASQEPDTVVNLTGLDGIKFGLKRADLAGYLNTDLPGCNTQLRDYPQGSLVFTADDRLVLMWFNAPLKTAEGIATGASLDAAKAAYPKATELKAPAGSHRFDGLLASSGDYGYLFLHDGKKVQKAIAGYVDYEHRLFDSGFGVC